jgi:hypothetical protein
MCTFAQIEVFPRGVARNCKIIVRGPARNCLTLRDSFGAVRPCGRSGAGGLAVPKRGLVISLAVAASTVRAVLSERCPALLAENCNPFKVNLSRVSPWLYVNLRWACHSSKLSVCAKLKIFPIPLRDRSGKIII